MDDLVENERVAYAVNTGVGHLADMRISRQDIRQLQVNLVRSHAVGVGEPLAEDVTRAMMLLRANSLAKGFSGVRPVVIDTLCEMLNRGVHPVIPSQGSVGASGDLAPLAHLALVLIGEGEVIFEGKRMAGGGRPEARRHQAAGAGGQGSDLADQRHPGHAGRGTADALQARFWPTPPTWWER